MSSQSAKLRVYFDGLCPLCSREIEHYRRQAGAERLDLVDITAPEFDAAAEGLDPRRVHQELHVRAPGGRVATGVDAFVMIWGALPRYRGLARLAGLPLVHPFLRMLYFVFARGIRPYLPKKRVAACLNSPYCDLEPARRKEGGA